MTLAHSQFVTPLNQTEQTEAKGVFRQKKQGLLYNLHLLLVHLFVFGGNSQILFLNNLFLYKYVNIQWMLSVVELRSAPILSVNTKRKMYSWQRKWSLSWYFTYRHLVAFKTVALLFVVSSATWTWLFIHYRADGQWAYRGQETEINQCTEVLRETGFRLSPVGNCEKSLSVTAINTWAGSAEARPEESPTVLNNTWLLILIACCIYFY